MKDDLEQEPDEEMVDAANQPNFESSKDNVSM